MLALPRGAAASLLRQNWPRRVGGCLLPPPRSTPPHAPAASASTCAAGAASPNPSSNPSSICISPLDHPPPALAAALPHLKEELTRFDPALPIEAASTPPSSWFTSQGFHDLEMASVFRSSPVAAGSALQIPSPGDYFTGNIGRQHPFIVLRDHEGRVRAFYNVCRHKGMRALIGECGSLGPNGRIACPYHGWEYRLDGRLAKATRLKGIQDFNAREFGLIEIPVSLWGGHLVFLHLDQAGQPQPQELTAALAHLAPLLERLEAEHGFSAGMRHVARRTYSLNCNWKVVIDNYADNAYHVPFAHKALGSNLDLGSYKATVHEGYSIQSCLGSAENASARVGQAALYAHVWPNLMLNRYGPWCDVNIVYPVSPRTCEIQFDYFLEERCVQEKLENGEQSHAALDAFIAESIRASDTVQQEDTFLCENVQIGLESAGYDRGRYAPGVEFPDFDFHLRLSQELRAAVARLDGAVQQRRSW